MLDTCSEWALYEGHGKSNRLKWWTRRQKKMTWRTKYYSQSPVHTWRWMDQAELSRIWLTSCFCIPLYFRYSSQGCSYTCHSHMLHVWMNSRGSDYADIRRMQMVLTIKHTVCCILRFFQISCWPQQNDHLQKGRALTFPFLKITDMHLFEKQNYREGEMRDLLSVSSPQ